MLQKSPVLDPSLKNLAYILRHREWWPDGFVWNYNYHCSCAEGISNELWNRHPASLPDSEFDLWWGDYNDIFLRPVSKWRHPFSGYRTRGSMVTPEIVASRIEKYLGM